MALSKNFILSLTDIFCGGVLEVDVVASAANAVAGVGTGAGAGTGTKAEVAVGVGGGAPTEPAWKPS